MFLAMTKQLTVVADPSITRIATSCSLRNPAITATGRKTAVSPRSLMADAQRAGPMALRAFSQSKDAPMAIRPRGVATAARLDTVFSMTAGCGMPVTDHSMPARIPRMIGLVQTPRTVRKRTCPSIFP